MTDMIVKIIVEFLSVLALAMKQVKQGRLSECAVTYTLLVTRHAIEKFAKRLFRESETEAILRRLDRLTQYEAQTAAEQTLGVVNGLMGNMSLAMSGTKWLHDSF